MKLNKKPVGFVEAVQLRQDNWDEMAQFVDAGSLADNKPEKCQLGDEIGLLIPFDTRDKSVHIARQNDWIIKEYRYTAFGIGPYTWTGSLDIWSAEQLELFCETTQDPLTPGK